MQAVQLSGRRLVLRPWVGSDVSALVAGLNDPDVERFLTTPPYPYTEADAERFIEKWAPDVWAGGGAEFALDLGDGRAIGSIGVSVEKDDRAAVGRVGYWVARASRGHGFAAEALGVLAAWAASNLGLCLDRQELVHDLANVASCRTAVKGGFQPEGLTVARHRDGSPRDVELHVWTDPSSL
jgi:RimJ/RimL family protein N-acetyltransferase